MASARPAFQLELRASDHYLVLLGGALLGYAVLGKYFAYLGIPPLFVGEIGHARQVVEDVTSIDPTCDEQP